MITYQKVAIPMMVTPTHCTHLIYAAAPLPKKPAIQALIRVQRFKRKNIIKYVINLLKHF